MDAGKLEEAQWELFFKGAGVDLESWHAWCVACGDRQTDLHFKELEWGRSRHEQCRAQARSLTVEQKTGACSQQIYTLTLQINTVDNMQLLNDVVAKLPTHNRINSIASADVVMVPILNWSSMALFTEAHKRAQSELFGMLVNTDATRGSIGLAVMPMIGSAHGGDHGQLWRTTSKAHETLYGCSVNPDRYFMVQYDRKTDERSNRPLLMKVVTATPLNGDLTKRTLASWKSAPCMTKQVTDIAHMVKTSDMVWPSACADTSLPDTTEESVTRHAVHTYAQLGVDAAEKILDMLIDVPTVALLHEQRKHIVVVDLTLGSSLDFARAMLKKLPHSDVSYVGFADDEEQRGFTEEFLQQECTEQLKGGSKCIPGFTPPPEAMPSSMAVGLPPKPTMNVLTYSDKKSNLGGVLQVETLQLPEKYMKTYHDHPTYGAEFRSWYAKMQKTMYLDRKADTTSDTPPVLRPAPPPEGEPNPKRLKTDITETVISNDELRSSTTFIHEIAIPKTKAVLLLAPGHVFYINNPSERELQLQPGLAIAEFFKGKWTNAADPQKASIQFVLQDSRDHVKLGQSFKPVDELLAERKKIKFDEAKIRYHDMRPAPLQDDPSHFVLSANQVVFFVLEPLPATTEDNTAYKVEWPHFGSALPPEVWSKVFLLTWFCKFTIRGLSPVRPVVVLKSCVVVPPHSAVRLDAVEPAAA